MCYLKTLKPLNEISVSKQNTFDTESQSDSSQTKSCQPSFLSTILGSKLPMILTKNDQILQKLFNIVNNNTFYVEQISWKLEKNQQTINNCFSTLNQMEAQPYQKIENDHQTSESFKKDHQEITIVDPLISKIFGDKKYQYRLQMKEELSSVLYKQRNINIPVSLVNLEDKIVLNSNIIHLCLGVYDQNGEWIAQNKAGQYFMKGKTEVQLYHGQGMFLKIYPRDVSRHFIDGKVNFIIYSKPSTINYSNNASSLQKIVDSSLIEPLIIRDITIKAKKKD